MSCAPVKHHHHVLATKAPIWVVFFGLAVVIYYLCLQNAQLLAQQAQQPSRAPAHLSTQQHVSAHSSCATGQRPQLAMMMVILGHENGTWHDQYWIAVANRRAYALQHSIPLYLVSGMLSSSEHPAWQKLVALQAVFQHSCAAWVWMNDADAYIMNIGHSIMDLAQNPMPHRAPKQLCNTSTPDVIAAGACRTHLNSGSVLWRNNNWTHHFVSDVWHSKFIAQPVSWWDQAGILHMYKQADTKQHICLVSQRFINAFPKTFNCHDGSGAFEEGDLLLHFPGGMKKAISNSSSKWLQAVPLLPSRASAATEERASIFTVTRFGTASDLALGQRVPVTMHRREHYALNSTQQIEFDLFVQPQSEGFSNWGWPIWPEPANLNVVLQQQQVGVQVQQLVPRESQQQQQQQQAQVVQHKPRLHPLGV